MPTPQRTIASPRSRRPARPASRGAAALVLLAALLPASTVRAQTTADDVDRLLNRAQEAYDNLELEESQRLLHEAIDLAESRGFEESIVAETYMMLGIVDYALGFDVDQVIDDFVAGLLIDRDAELDPYYTTPDLDALLDQARAELPEEIVEPPPPAVVLTHSPIVTVRAGQPIELLAAVEDSGEVAGVDVFFRPFGQTRYQRQEMQQNRPGQYRTVLPADVTEAGIQLEYYLEAYGATGDVLAESGNTATPHVVVILGETDGGREREHPIMSAAIGAGTGGGLATGDPVVMGDEVDLNPGMALTPLHFYVDAAFRLGGSLELGPFLRLQTVLLEDGVELETIVGGKLKWYFADEPSLRMYASAGAGWGHVRHTVDLAPTIDFVDTTREGPFHIGVGFGVAYLFTEHVGILADIYSMVLFDQVSVQLDLNAGLYLSF